MKVAGRTSFWLFGIFILSGFFVEVSAAQENTGTPSKRAKEAAQSPKTAASIGKSLDALTEAANLKPKQMLGGKAEHGSRSESDDLSVLPKNSSGPEPARYSPKAKRDPFRPPSLQTRTSTQVRANLSPLERIELRQLVVVGIIWDVQEPRAMIEDNTGLGYIVKIGTPIGRSDGRVKAIHPNNLIVEESFEDFSGAKKKREVTMKLPVN